MNQHLSAPSGPSKQPPLPQELTVILFKDNLTSKTFKVPLKWISRLGLILSGLVCLTGISTYFGVKYYTISIRNRTSRIEDLESRLPEIEQRMESPDTLSGATPQSPLTPYGLIPPAEQSILSSSATGQGLPFFTLFPDPQPASIPDPATLPFSIQNQKLQWEGTILKVYFALQYTKDDHKSQQGRIVILGRGNSIMAAYPIGLLNPAGSPSLVLPSRGGYFSVSRFREVRADLGPISKPQQIQEVEIFIFDRNDKILTYQKLKPPQKNE